MNPLKKIYEKVTRDRWEIGFVKGDIDSLMSSDSIDVNWLRHTFKDRWFADPFILDVTNSEITILCEEYQYSTNKGRIAELIVDKGSFALKEMNIILELSTHLSFPAIWRENGHTYIYPESWMSGTLTLYEYVGRGEKLKQIKTLCYESIADSIMTDYLGWKVLLSTTNNRTLRLYEIDPDSGYYIFSKEIDFRTSTARNAGDFFKYYGKTYRPAQVCINAYGEAIEIQEVQHTEGNISFTPIKRLHSPHPKLDTGMHTLNTYKGITVIDVHGWVNPRIVSSIIATKKILGIKNGRRKKPNNY